MVSQVNNYPKESYVDKSVISLKGKGLPSSSDVRVKLLRTDVTGEPEQELDRDRYQPIRKPDGAWEVNDIRFNQAGAYQLRVDVLESGNKVGSASTQIHVASLASSPNSASHNPVKQVVVADDTVPLDLSSHVRSIYDQGPEPTVLGFAAVTAMEIAFSVKGSERSLSSRYVYEKSKQLEAHKVSLKAAT